jgi:hypothetical protein
MYQEVKQILINDTDLLISILEDVGFYDIKKYSSEIRCSLPDGDNYTAVQIYLSNLYCNVWSRADYEDFEIKDIFSLIAYAQGCNVKQALVYVGGILGVNTDDQIKFKKSEALADIKKYRTLDKEYNVSSLSEDVLKLYKPHIVKEWVDEGIDEEAQSEFEVHIDVREKRWCFTLRDFDGRLIGRKGRTYVKDFELLRIPKYLYYNANGSSALYNAHRAKQYIEECGECIIVESEKSAMKLWSMGIKNVVAIGNKKISPYIARQILSFNCKNIVFALDKDVLESDVRKEAYKFRLFRNCFVMIDNEDILDKKDAPCDKGLIDWVTLYEKRKRVR